MATIVARYPGTCKRCGNRFEAGATIAYQDRASYHVRCAPAVPGGAPVPATLAADGTVSMAYDLAALPLLRALPVPAGQKSTWDPAAKVWRASVSDADLPRTLELAGKLQLTIAPELIARNVPTAAASAANLEGLYPFQVQGVDHLSRRPRALLGDEMGLGKTVQALRALDPSWAVLVVCPNSLKLNWVKEAKRWAPGLRAEALQGKAGFRWPQPGELLAVNYDVLPGDLGLAGQPKGLTVVLDECFTYSTKVLTDQGWLQIGDIVEYRLPVRVAACDFSRNEVVFKEVTHYFKNRRHQRLVKIRHSAGELVCTENHRVWTENRGYVEAAKLEVGDDLRLVRAGVCAEAPAFQGVASPALLQHVVLGEVAQPAAVHDAHPAGDHAEGGSVASRDGSTGPAPAHAEQQSVSSTRSGAAGSPDAASEGDAEHLVGRAWRQWDADSAGACAARGVGWRVGSAAGGTDQATARERVSDLVQGRRGERPASAGDRDRWEGAPTSNQASVGSKEGGAAYAARVEGVEVLQFGRGPAADGGAGDHSFVYCLEVNEHHNFFADGVLVSNCQYVKNYKAARSKKVTTIAEQAVRCWALTGTPLANRALDLWGVLGATGMAREVFGGWQKFVSLFGGCKNRWGGWDFAPQASVEAAERLRRVMLRRLRAEVLPDLPAKTYQTLVVNELPRDLARDLDLAEEQYEADCEAWDMERDDLVGYGGGGEPRRSRLPKFDQFSGLRARLAASRIEAMLEQVELSEESGEPLVVFSAHRAPIDELAKREGWRVITGDTPVAERQTTVDAFQAGDLKGVGLTIAAGGTGLTLTRANRMLFVDLDWVPANNAQAEDRCIAAGTPVLTRKGWVKIEDVQIGDEVITHTGASRKVTDAWSSSARKWMADVEIHGYGTVTSTHDHRFMLANGDWRQASQLRPGDVLAMPGIDTCEALTQIEFDGARIAKTFEGAGGLQRNGRLIKAPEKIDITDDFLFVCGYYAGDGFSSTAGGKGRFVSLSGNDGKKQPALERCRSWFDANGMSEHEHRGSEHGVERRYFSAEWASWFQQSFGHGARNKQLPEFLLRLSRAQSIHVLAGLAASDGYDRDELGRIEYCTTSPTLAAHVLLLATRCGFRPGLRRDQEGRHTVTWYDKVSGRSPGIVAAVTIRNPSRKDGRHETVHDLTVEVDESFVTGSVVVHNCVRIGQTAKSVIIVRMVSAHPLDQHVQALLEAKTRLAFSAIDATAAGPVVPAGCFLPEASKPEGQKRTPDLDVPLAAPAVSEELRSAVHSALRALAGMCDGAIDLDGAGFNKFDSRFGHELASREELTDGQVRAGRKMVIKYQRQLPESLVAVLKRKEY